ncbi:SAM-dependent chlorinase/fluorinase [Actinomadura sp. B10D3]|uniref:SAM hydrolase/SAM-dependent halogenase family protein n=1 Tax=Actinomadura sp. B10D3 TaxID=3153557 RepID=UPI00325CB630
MPDVFAEVAPGPKAVRFDIREGAMLLRGALPYMPVGGHVGIVDPGVGTPRRPVAIKTRRGDVPAYRLPEVSTSFHGRDVFSPAAAHVAAGVDAAELGAAADPLPLDVPAPVAGDGELTAPVLYTDRFGSLVLGAGRADLAAAFGTVEPGTPLDVE